MLILETHQHPYSSIHVAPDRKWMTWNWIWNYFHFSSFVSAAQDLVLSTFVLGAAPYLVSNPHLLKKPFLLLPQIFKLDAMYLIGLELLFWSRVQSFECFLQWWVVSWMVQLQEPWEHSCREGCRLHSARSMVANARRTLKGDQSEHFSLIQLPCSWLSPFWVHFVGYKPLDKFPPGRVLHCPHVPWLRS